MDVRTNTTVNIGSQVFNFSESFSRFNTTNSPSYNLGISQTSALPYKIFRKSSELVGEREKLSAFQKVDQIQKPQALHSGSSILS